jgi:GT2 family glycosyltransferase
VQSLLLQIDNNIIQHSKSKIIIVDNSESKSEVQQLLLLKEQFTNVVIIISNINQGYSAGNNLGLKYCKDNNIKYYTIANPDIEIPYGFNLDYHLKQLDEFNAVIIGPKVYNPYTNTTQGPYERPYLLTPITDRLKTYVNHIINRQRIDKDLARPTYMLVGCFFTGTIAKIADLNFLDENIFLYYEEFVLAEKIYQTGSIAYYDSDQQVNHKHKVEYKSRKSEFSKNRVMLKSLRYYYTNIRGYNKLAYRLIEFVLLILLVLKYYSKKIVRIGVSIK